MAMQKGHPKLGGRKKGTPNKIQMDVKKSVQEFCAMHGYHPIQAMAAIAMDETQDVNVRLAASREVAKYHNPQLRALEISGSIAQKIEVEIYWHQQPQSKPSE